VKTYVLTYPDSSTKTVRAARYELKDGAAVFYDEDGEEVATFSGWISIKP